MASVIKNAKALNQARKYMKHRVGDKNDPYKEEVISAEGKKVKAYRDIPDFIPRHDAEILATVKDRAYSADQGYFGKFGWEGIIGFFLPAIGDTIGVIYSLIFIVWTCTKIDGGLPKPIRNKMLRNVAIDWSVGLIPVAGDIIDVIWRCNTQNVRLLENHLRKKYGPKDKRARYSAGLFHYNHNKQDMEKLQTAGASPISHEWGDLDEERDDNQYDTQSRWQQPYSVAAAHRSDGPRHDTRHQRTEHDARPQNPSQQPIGTTEEPIEQSTKPQSNWGRLFGFGKKERQGDPETGEDRTNDR